MSQARTPGAKRAGPGEYVFDPAGQPSSPHSHPNEQWIFILEGTLEVRFDGDWHLARAGEVIYVPANKVHQDGGKDAKGIVGGVGHRI